MTRFYTALICAILALSTINPVFARRSYGRGGSHSYPHSGGLSGSGSHHSYPKSPGLSGGGSHGYPSSGGLSGGGSHGYPNSGGLSGSGARPAYPSNTQHHSNQHGYPASTGLSGNKQNPSPGHTTINNHYNYNYNPPQQIRYTPVHGGAPVSYPVYHGTPPTYVYQYRDSGSKYGTLLAGLALFNLGALGGYAVGHSGSNSHSNYKPAPGEVCKFGIKKDNGDYEETRIDCQLITSFIFQAEAEKQHNPSSTNTTVVTTSVTNVTMVNNTNDSETPAPAVQVEPKFTMLPNGTLVPMNVTGTNETVNLTNETAPTATTIAPAADTANKAADAVQTMTSSVTVTNTTTTVTNAVDVKGPAVQVTPGMQCYVIRHTPSSNMKKSVPCALLQTYSEKSLRKNSANRNAPVFTLLSVAFVAFVLY